MRKYVQLVIITIFVFIFLNTILFESVTNYILNLFVFGILLYITSIGYIFPLMKSLVGVTKTDGHLASLIEEVNISSARNFLNARTSSEIDGNPIFEITGLINIILQNNERLLLVDIINSLELKIKESIISNDEDTTREFVKAVLSIYKTLINLCIKNGTYSLPEIILQSYFSIKKYAAKNKKSHFIFFEFDMLIENTISKFFALDYNAFIESYLYSIFSYLEYNIEHFLPDESDLFTFNMKDASTLNKKYDNELSFQWDLIENKCVYNVQKIIELASENANHSVLNEVGYRFVAFISYVVRSKLLGDKQKRRLLLHYDFRYKNLVENLIHINRTELDLYFMSPFMYDDILGYDEDLFLMYFNSFEDIIILLFKSNQMSEIRLNDFGTMARGLPKYVDKYKVVPILLKRVMTLFQKVGLKYLDELSFDRILMYKEIYKQSDSIIRFAKSAKCKDEFVSELNEIHSKLEDPKELDSLLDDVDALYDTKISDLFKIKKSDI
jgi:hypothetical protein